MSYHMQEKNLLSHLGKLERRRAKLVQCLFPFSTRFFLFLGWHIRDKHQWEKDKLVQRYWRPTRTLWSEIRTHGSDQRLKKRRRRGTRRNATQTPQPKGISAPRYQWLDKLNTIRSDGAITLTELIEKSWRMQKIMAKNHYWSVLAVLLNRDIHRPVSSTFQP